jgi:VWFA-related protein
MTKSKNSLILLALGVCGLTLPLDAQAPRQAQATDSKTRDIYVSVVDGGKGAAVTGLTAKDFTVREDGVAREVLRAVPATAPLDIVLLVDDSQAATTAIPYLRDGLTRFVERLQGKASIGLVTIGERPTSVAERTKDIAAVKKGISRIFARPGAGAYLLEGILDTSRGFQKRDTERPVIVAIATEGVEFSSQAYERVLDTLYASGATLHVLMVGSPSSSMSDEIRNRNITVAEGTEGTGGRREQLLTELAIPDALTKLADELLNQYLVTYGRPEALVPPEKVQVSVTRPGLEARARTRLPQK